MLKLIPPKPGRSVYWRVRGTYHGQRLDRSTETGDRRIAAKFLARWKEDIERSAYAKPEGPDFATAALSYMQAGGERRFLEPLLNYFQRAPLEKLDQAAIDKAAIVLYPTATPATRNRQVYSPLSAVLRHAGIKKAMQRPKGARGESRVAWLKPEEAFKLLKAADRLKPSFGALCTFLLYTGCRLSEGLTLAPEDVDLTAGIARVRKTKNGEPRTVFLPPVVIAALANIEFATKTVFGFPKSGRLYKLLAATEKASGVTIPERVAFHIFRHSWATWMRRYGGLDTSGLVATGAWKSRQAAAVYEHLDATEEAKKAILLPSERKNG